MTLRNYLRIGSFIAACALALAAPAHADQPGIAFRTAPLVDPSTALGVYGNPASPAAATTADPLVAELARSLRYDIDLIYEHVRDHVDIIPIYGAQKGARGAIYDETGTAFDQAQLMVELLREADRVSSKGYSPRYKLGQITLTGAQFFDWFGISNADVARSVLANGGIPAIVNGSGATITSVTVSHIWVEATINGSTYAFDPSYKAHVRGAKIDVPAVSGYNGTNLLNAGSSGATYDASSIKGFNTTAFNGQLTQYRSNLESYLRGSLPGRTINSIVGTPEIVPHTSAESRRQTLPYAVSTDATWTGEIPDIYRTTVTLTMGTGSSGKLFADAIYGKQFRYYFSYSSGWVLGGGSENSASSGSLCDTYTNPVAGKPFALLNVTIDHPYAALNGSYMDRTLVKPMTGVNNNGGCTQGEFLFTLDFGAEGIKRLSEVRRWAAEMTMNPMPDINLITAPTLKNIPVAFSRYAQLADQQFDLVTQIHDLIGVHNVDVPWIDLNGGGGLIAQRMLAIDFEAGISTNSRVDATPARIEAAKYVASMGLAVAESAVPRQELDSVREVSPLTLVTDQDRLAATPGQYRLFLANGANWSSVQSSLRQYGNDVLGAISGYINDGYNVLVPERGDLTPGTYTSPSGATTKLADAYLGSTFFRQGFFALRSGANGVDSAGLMTFNPREGRPMKGGAGVQTSAPDGRGLSKPAVPKMDTKDPVVSVLQVEPSTGAISYSPPVDLRDGSADSPYSIQFKRVYNSMDISDIGLGVGWSHNLKNTVSLAGDTLAAFGDKGALGAASALVAQQAAFDIAMSGSIDPRTLLAILKTQQWLAAQSLNNIATVEEGVGGGSTFARMADGTFAGVQPNAGLLVQNGAPVETMLNRWAYYPVSFTYSHPDGSARTYSYVGGENPDLDLMIDIGRLTRKTFYMSNWTSPTGVSLNTVFERQPTIDLIYLYNASNNLGNSLAVSQALSIGDTGNSAYCVYPYNYQQPVYRPYAPGLLKYHDSAGNEVQFEKTPGYHFAVNSAWLEEQNGNCGTTGQLLGSTYVYAAYLTGATTAAGSGQPAGPKWTYGRVGRADNQLYEMSSIFKPSDSTVPAAQIAYGSNDNTRSVTDALSSASLYRVAAYRYDQEDPMGGQSVTYLDLLHRPIRSVDPLGRTKLTVYNDAGQVMRQVEPEGDAVEYQYDARGNTVQECKIGKGRVAWASLADPKAPQCNSALGDLVATTAYVEGPTLRMDQCVNLKTCNKPLYVIDANGNRTDYAWDATLGVLQSETHGLNSSDVCAVTGGCPQITYGYTAFTGTNYVPFYLLTSKTEKINATTGTTTTYAYDTANKFALKQVVVDNGGLNLRTCGKFDGVGNLISMSDPRQGVCP